MVRYKYYYDVNERKCKTFVYGGCNGNSNRFETITECMERCGLKRGITAESGEDYGSKNDNGNDKSGLEL
ncbi:hypothetical protein MSG28_004052 [Choristoneura fumiferana]|uniref:Uncharacterized protein n=1 Tax=Choristoneura fumiferana TaxID=7141 RepID=A0ACC0KH22_CHOFU|nr:hypothetical protein MSG28_004052 [Choristoneura fumiferana]